MAAGEKKGKILVIHGPNLNMLGRREPAHYGTSTLEEIDSEIKETAQRIDLDVESRFAFLGEEGVRDGDHLYYTLRGDSVLSRYVDVDGNTTLDDVRVGAAWRLWLLGNYFVAGTHFRNGLLDLVFDR